MIKGQKADSQILQANGTSLWQLQAALSMGILYLFYYFCKYNIGPATQAIQNQFGFDNRSIGMITTVFTLVYAGGQFVNGFLGDRYGPKTIVIIGGLGGVVANIFFGLSGTLTSFVLFWGLNAYFSSMGWSPGCRIMFNWFPENKWGQWMGIYNALCYSGGAIVLPIVAFSIKHWGWQAAFIVPPAFLLTMTIIFIFLGKNSPQDVGLLTEWEPVEKQQNARKVNLSDYTKAFSHPKMILAYITGFGCNFIRWGLMSWIIKILHEPVAKGGFGLELMTSALIASMMHWGGAFFSIVLGIITDTIFNGTRWQTISIGCFLTSGTLLFIGIGPSILHYPGGISLLGLAMFVAGGINQGIQSPLFDLPGDILGKELGSTGAGILDGWMYVGASFAGYFLGWVLDSHGLLAGIFLMAMTSAICGVTAMGIRK